MDMICPKCGRTLSYDLSSDVKDPKGECPGCHAPICLSKFRKEYKLLTHRDLCGRKSLDDDDVKKRAESVLNKYACAGWRIVAVSTHNESDFSIGGNHSEPLFVLERDVPR